MPTLDKTEEKQPPQPKNKAGRPRKGEERQIGNAARFFETLKKVPASAWSEGKAVVKVYRVEPCIDRTASGKPKHIQEYYEPIESEERIKYDHGSGKYLLFLTYQGAKEAQMREIERTPIDILDMKYPPQVPAGDWLDEPKNKGWAWAFPKDAAQPQQTPIAQLAETLDVLDGIHERAAERNTAEKQQPSMLEIIKTVKELMPPPPAAPSPATENKMLDTIVTLMNNQLDRQQRDNEALRKEMSDMRKAEQPAKPALGSLKDLLDQAKELGILPEGGLKDLWNKAEGAHQSVTRSRMSGTEEFLQPIVTKLVEAVAPVLPMAVARWMQPKPPQPGQPPSPEAPALPAAVPTAPGAATAPAGAQPPAAETQPAPAADQQPQAFTPPQAFTFIREFSEPFIRWFKEGLGSGGDFAEWVYDGHGPDWKGLKWLHMKAAIGPDPIVQMYRNSPFWPEIAAAEPKFQEFVKAFVDWQPEANQAVIDLDNEEEDEPEIN